MYLCIMINNNGLTRQQIEDVIVTAFEGGSNFWLAMSNEQCALINTKEGLKVHGSFAERATAHIFAGNSIEILDREDTSDVLGQLNKEGIFKARPETKELTAQIINGTYDAETADMLMQYWVMGTYTFG